MNRIFIREHYQITLPLDIRKMLPLDVGDPAEIEINKKGEIVIKLLKAVDVSQAWFWSAKHQEAEEEAEKERLQKKGKKVKGAKGLIDELEK
ncbi:MAG: AbrB/MazE/SpoVT family DNA-binding domain-containing protein [Candidatus Omnitrophota bacterium]